MTHIPPNPMPPYKAGTRMAGKTVIVFGAGSSGPGWGNGKAAAVLYAREGARVACVDINLEAAEETVGLIAAENGEAMALAADVTRLESIEQAVTATIARFGRIDVVHNNVGMVVPGGAADITEEGFQRGIDLNLGPVWRSAKVMLPRFLAQGHGVFVNIASIAGIRWTGYPYFIYSAAKAAVIQATKAIALHHAAQNIRANAILPGMMNTPLVYQQIAGSFGTVEEVIAKRNQAVPTGKMGTAYDIAAAALFLASDESRFITGVALPVDGGQTETMRS
ncbi:MAG: SDR family oxidoreductase [Beijerinckiaceae bacterium]|nr:SDR family oxidoreductase [Beijerinckiaceae bacterium]